MNFIFNEEVFVQSLQDFRAEWLYKRMFVLVISLVRNRDSQWNAFRLDRRMHHENSNIALHVTLTLTSSLEYSNASGSGAATDVKI